MLKKGTAVVMHSCNEAQQHEGRIWECLEDSYILPNGQHVVQLACFEGLFSVDYLQKVKVASLERTARIERKDYTLNWLMEYTDKEAIMQFMEGCTILEVRSNRNRLMLDSANLLAMEYYYSEAYLEIPEEVMLSFMGDSPSLMFRKFGVDYVVSINPLYLGWMLMEVEYTNM